MSQPDRPGDADAIGGSGKHDDDQCKHDDQRKHDTNWGRVVYVAIALITAAAVWVLIFSSVLLARSGDTTSSLLGLAGQSQRNAQQLASNLQRSHDQTVADQAGAHR